MQYSPYRLVNNYISSFVNLDIYLSCNIRLLIYKGIQNILNIFQPNIYIYTWVQDYKLNMLDLSSNIVTYKPFDCTLFTMIAPRRLERSPRKQKVGCSNPSRDRFTRPTSCTVVQTESDSSAAKRSARSVIVTGHRRWLLSTDALCSRSCGKLKNPHCSMTMWRA